MPRAQRRSLLLPIAVATVLLASGSASAEPDAAALWKANCTPCHGKEGKAETPAGMLLGAADLTDPAVQAELDRERIMATIRQGITKGGKEKMKAFGDKLTDEEISALADHVETLSDGK